MTEKKALTISILVIPIVILIISAFLLHSCGLLTNYPKDNPVEELVEDVLEQEIKKRYDLDLDIDFTPNCLCLFV